jgi:hypothetical protein
MKNGNITKTNIRKLIVEQNFLYTIIISYGLSTEMKSIIGELFPYF